jgi:hAT family C-terminal dimerisation region
VIVYYFVPTNNLIGEQERVLTTLKAYLPPDDVPRATQAFLRFYTRRGPFREDHSSWGYAEDPVMFWQLHFDDNNALAQLADRVLYTLANSVPCERAFSALNQLHIKTRNALTPERVNELLYIQINSRTLRRDALVGKLLEDENEDEDEDEEDDLVVDGEGDATFARPGHTNEALPGPNGLAESSQDELV